MHEMGEVISKKIVKHCVQKVKGMPQSSTRDWIKVKLRLNKIRKIYISSEFKFKVQKHLK